MRLSKLATDALIGNNFIKKGSAFFRINGNGVVQVVKYTYERNGDVPYVLSLGLMSMYAELSADEFTASGCCPKYEIAHACGMSETSAEDNQELLLVQKVLPWLNKMTSQQLLLDGILYLDSVSMGKILWNESRKLVPFLFCQEYALAERVVKSILKQHSHVRCLGYPQLVKFLSPQRLEQKMKRLEQDDYELLKILSLVQSRDPVRIRHYLEQNFIENCGLVQKKLGRQAIALLNRSAKST